MLFVAAVSNPRTFIVRVSETPRRVIVEDVRHRRRAVAEGLDGVGAQIAVWLQTQPPEPKPLEREDSVSPAS